MRREKHRQTDRETVRRQRNTDRDRQTAKEKEPEGAEEGVEWLGFKMELPNMKTCL